ncbi:hypothetical protein B0H13DRAFT_2378124 [Mycena leptocephala]|nr:hypothetical protein B0H13DRAFT_2378124 [Mycena leptocephala]
MSSLIPIAPGFSYVAASMLSTVFLLTGQSITVSRYRKRAGINYPRLYADEAEMAVSPAAIKFNCIQRAHQNTLENIPQVYLMTVLLGQTQPVLAASAVGLWVAGRVAYTVGYASGDPANRSNLVTRITSLPSMGTLYFGSMYSVYTLISAGI